MKTLLYTISITLLVLSAQSCSFNSVRGNGNITENEVNISDYKEIEFSGGSSIVYEQKPDAAPYLRIETDENIFPLLIVESNDGILSIRNKENVSPTKYNIYTNSTALARVSVSGSIKLHIKGKLETTDLVLSVSGSANILGDSIVAQSVTTKVSGSGDITMTGKANRIESSISGSGKTNTMDMQADTVTCSVSGSGNFSVYAEKLLTVRVSGSGNVQYKGNAQVDQAISGSGKVVKVQ